MEYLKNGIKILETLNNHGYEAFFVGGAVRDYLLNKDEIKDIDITTNCITEKVLQIFEGIETGKKYGCVTVYLNNFSFEVVTYRIDGIYKDGRHPESIKFTNSLENDLARRDFTINALVMDRNLKVFDYVNGLVDLRKKIIRAIGNPAERFEEDAIRMLRAVYFSLKLDFKIDEDTFEAIKRSSALINKVASERIILELKKCFQYGKSEKIIKLLYESDLNKSIPNFKRGMEFLYKANTNLELSFKELLALIYYFDNVKFCDYWRFSNKELSDFKNINNLALVTEKEDFTNLLIYSYGKELALIANKINVIVHNAKNQEVLITKIDWELPIKKTCELKFKGNELITLYNLKSVNVISEIVDDIKFEVINHRLRNDFSEIKAYVEKKYLGGVIFGK